MLIIWAKGESCWLSAGNATRDVPMLFRLLAVVLFVKPMP